MYKLRNGAGVIRLSDGAVIMPDQIGRHWREYLDWMYAGNEPLPADPEPEPVVMVDKSLIVSRLTDEELELFRVAKTTFPARLVFLWEDATLGRVNPKDERLVNAFVEILGEERALEVLAT